MNILFRYKDWVEQSKLCHQFDLDKQLSWKTRWNFWINRNYLFASFPQKGDTLFSLTYKSTWRRTFHKLNLLISERLSSLDGKHFVLVSHLNGEVITLMVYELEWHPLFPILDRMRNDPYRWVVSRVITREEFESLSQDSSSFREALQLCSLDY